MPPEGTGKSGISPSEELVDCEEVVKGLFGFGDV